MSTTSFTSMSGFDITVQNRGGGELMVTFRDPATGVEVSGTAMASGAAHLVTELERQLAEEVNLYLKSRRIKLWVRRRMEEE